MQNVSTYANNVALKGTRPFEGTHPQEAPPAHASESSRSGREPVLGHQDQRGKGVLGEELKPFITSAVRV